MIARSGPVARVSMYFWSNLESKGEKRIKIKSGKLKKETNQIGEKWKPKSGSEAKREMC